MDRRVKERLVGASILTVLIVLIVPELLSGPAPPAAPVRAAAIGRPAANAPEPVRNVTVDLATSKAPTPEPADAVGASSPEPSVAPAAAAGAAGAEAASSATDTDAGGDRVSQPANSTPYVSAAPQPRERIARPARLETSPQTPRNDRPARAAGGGWAVQLGSFGSRANADKLMRQLKAQGFAAYVVSGGAGRTVRYRVRVGPMADRTAAAQTLAKLKASGHAASFVPPAR